ncbi:hypothetical protein JCM13304A_11740 [Desulfothermus okinawensis JCM 13304]
MLTIRCAKCKKKLWKYKKIGKGEVLRCHKDRITKSFGWEESHGKIFCPRCKTPIGIDKGTFYKMIGKNFVYNGTKDNS